MQREMDMGQVGKRLFPDGLDPRNLDLREIRRFSSGIVIVECGPAK